MSLPSRYTLLAIAISLVFYSYVENIRFFTPRLLQNEILSVSLKIISCLLFYEAVSSL
jgi:hypothetical protein